MQDATSSKRETREESYHRRVKAAGLTGDMPEAADEYRNRFARQIFMHLNRWHGCPELLCRRHRGCMAPNIRCSNIEYPPPEEERRRWEAAKAGIIARVRAHLAAQGVLDD